MKSKIVATIQPKQTGYDALQPVIDFNNISGNESVERSLLDSLPQLYRDLVEEEYIEMQEAFELMNLKEVVDSAGDLITVCAGLLHSLGYNPNDVMKAINESNHSKFCYNETDAIKSVEQYEGDDRYVNVHYRKVGNVYVVYGQKAGGDGWKILKGVDYHEPDFSQIVGG